MRRTVYITAERLAAELRWKKPPVILDVRWSLTAPNGEAAYRAGHIPGAIYVDLEAELSGPASQANGRHPLPNIADLQHTARTWGLNNGDAVVVYDDFFGAAASRAWWILKWAGIKNVRILDGGYPTWAGHGRIDTGKRKKLKRKNWGNITLTPGNLPTITADEAERFSGVLVDARAPMRYRGEFEPMDSRAGHIPRALNSPYDHNLTPHGTIRPEAELREKFGAVGALGSDSVAVYCGSGVTATHNIAALASLGVQAALYPGSWSQWSADDTREAALGS